MAAGEQRVLFRSKQLEDDVKLSEAGVGEEDTLYVLLRLLGGAKKRKKKTYTKPKKQKHKHKKVKLAVLKYYKVCFCWSSFVLPHASHAELLPLRGAGHRRFNPGKLSFMGRLQYASSFVCLKGGLEFECELSHLSNGGLEFER